MERSGGMGMHGCSNRELSYAGWQVDGLGYLLCGVVLDYRGSDRVGRTTGFRAANKALVESVGAGVGGCRGSYLDVGFVCSKLRGTFLHRPGLLSWAARYLQTVLSNAGDFRANGEHADP